jgi:hypothetical protein
LEAFFLNRAERTDLFGGGDLIYGGAGAANRKEETWFGVPTGGYVTPFGGDSEGHGGHGHRSFVKFFT